jgi:DNA-directed RNA polymerase specialized sigma24 family protein
MIWSKYLKLTIKQRKGSSNCVSKHKCNSLRRERFRSLLLLNSLSHGAFQFQIGGVCVLEQKLNMLAIAFAGGDRLAGEEFVGILEPLLKSFATKRYAPIEFADLVQEFMLVAIECCYKFADRYNDGQNNVLGLVYQACKRKLFDIRKAHGSMKRSLYRNVSFQVEDQNLSEKVPNGEQSVEEIVFMKLYIEEITQAIKEVRYKKERDSNIVKTILFACINDQSTDDLNENIAQILKLEIGEEPKAVTIRKAKSRALQKLRSKINYVA